MVRRRIWAGEVETREGIRNKIISLYAYIRLSKNKRVGGKGLEARKGP